MVPSKKPQKRWHHLARSEYLDTKRLHCKGRWIGIFGQFQTS